MVALKEKKTMSLRTPVTDLFGTEFPIVAGGLQFLADAEYVAACAKAGIIGFMTSNHFQDEKSLRNEICKTRELSEGKPFGVNIAMLPKSTEHEKAQAVGVDMVTIVGWECGGHPGPNAIGSIVNAALAEERLSIPYLIGGGIGHGSQIAAALSMGASGVLLGTRFLASTEIGAHEGYKEALLKASENDTTISLWSVRNNARTLANETTWIVAELERANPEAGIAQLMPYVAGQILIDTYKTGDTSLGMVYAGQALGFVRESVPVAETVKLLIQQFNTARERLCSLSY